MPASPVQVPGEGPPTITYSISGCAHSAGLGVPRSQAARIERTSSTFADAIDQAWHTRESGGPASPGRTSTYVSIFRSCGYRAEAGSAGSIWRVALPSVGLF